MIVTKAQATTEVKDSIFEVAEMKTTQDSAADKLRGALKQQSGTETLGLEKQLDLLATSAEITETAKRESVKTQSDIYQEVFIDEINGQLLNSVLKTEGDTIVLLMRQERLKSFIDLWRNANLDYYNTQTKEIKQLQMQANKVEELK